MPLQFRPRDYRKEEKIVAASLPPRSPAHDHPLAAPSPHPSSSPPPPLRSSSAGATAGPSHKAYSSDYGKVDDDDPLGVHISNETLYCDMHHMYNSSPRRQSDEAVQLSVKEWAVFKNALMQKFTFSSTVRVPVACDIILRQCKEYEGSMMHPEEWDDPEKAVEDENKFVTQQEYVSRLRELKVEIRHTWRNEDRITSLKLSIKVARLLMDTSVFQFYPTLFTLVTDVMDMLGDLVWERIKKKAEYADDGTLVCTLRDDFVSGDVPSDAKETCYNWFCKIGSIRELLPRIYLELAILRCWRFLQDRPSNYLGRLTMMIRGLADPLAAAYCHLYMVHCAGNLVPDDKGYLVMCINDISILLRRIIEEREAIYSNFAGNKKLLISLLEPAIEWTMKSMFRGRHQNVDNILVEFGLKGKASKSNQSLPCFSILLHYLLKELPVKIISMNALDIFELLEHNNDISLDQHLNYRLLGLKLSECQLPVHFANSVVNKVFQVVSKYDGLNEYLMVVDAYFEIILQCEMDNSLSAVLDCVLQRAKVGSLTDNEMDNLQSILLKLIHHFKSLGDAFTLNDFLPTIDLLHGDPRNIVSKHILGQVARGAFICDPTMIQFLFEVSRVLHDGINISSSKDDHQQIAGLICHFVQMVDFGNEVERHLDFLMDCRAAFRNLDELKESFIHSSNVLAKKAMKCVNKFHGFVKSCVAFNEVTIPSISAGSSRLNLYLETAEVAFSGGLVSHLDGLLDSAITCLDSTNLNMGPQLPSDMDWKLSSILRLCSILIMVPGIYGGASRIVQVIFSIVESQSWVTPVMRVKLLCAIISSASTLSQEHLPYQISASEIMCNDLLFFGEKSYYEELESTSNLAVCSLVASMEKEPHTAAQGKLALDVCNCLVISFRASEELHSLCCRMIRIATSFLHPQDGYLQSTIKFLNKSVPDSVRAIQCNSS